MEVVRSSGKLLLMGEHAILQGYPALGLALPLEMKLLYQSGTGPWKWSGVPEVHQSLLMELVERLVELSPHTPPKPGDLTLFSELPLSSGFGSSATLCSALVRAFYPELESQQVWELSHEAEKIFHGTPSGIDTALAVFGGLLGFTPGGSLPKNEVLKGFPLSLVVVSHPRTQSTKYLVGELLRRMREKDPETSRHMEALGQVCQQTWNLFQNPPTEGAPQAFADFCNEAHKRLDHLGMSTPGLEDLQKRAQDRGALGGKLSGAGGGGAQFFVSETPAKARQLALDLRHDAEKYHIQLNFLPTAFAFEPPSLRILEEESW